MKLYLAIVSLVFSAQSFSQSEIDQKLRSYIERFNYNRKNQKNKTFLYMKWEKNYFQIKALPY